MSLGAWVQAFSLTMVVVDVTLLVEVEVTWLVVEVISVWDVLARVVVVVAGVVPSMGRCDGLNDYTAPVIATSPVISVPAAPMVSTAPVITATPVVVAASPMVSAAPMASMTAPMNRDTAAPDMDSAAIGSMEGELSLGLATGKGNHCSNG